MAEPVSLLQVRRQLRIDPDADTDLLTGYVAAARAHVEQFTGITLKPNTIVELHDGFPEMLRSWPVEPATAVIRYQNGSGSDVEYVGARIGGGRPARLSPAPSTSWPATLAGARETVAVRIDAGYADPAAIPADIVQAVLMLVAHWYRNREAVVIGAAVAELPMAVQALLAPHRRWYS